MTTGKKPGENTGKNGGIFQQSSSVGNSLPTRHNKKTILSCH